MADTTQTQAPGSQSDTDVANDAQQGIQLSVSPEVQRGAFANQTLIANTPEEFVLDFIFASAPTASITSRVILTPAHAKRLVAALHNNIQEYERTFGKINITAPANDANAKKEDAKKPEQTIN